MLLEFLVETVRYTGFEKGYEVALVQLAMDVPLSIRKK